MAAEYGKEFTIKNLSVNDDYSPANDANCSSSSSVAPKLRHNQLECKILAPSLSFDSKGEGDDNQQTKTVLLTASNDNMKSFFENLHHLQQRGELCDVIIEVCFKSHLFRQHG